MGDTPRRSSDTTAVNIWDAITDLPKFVEEVLGVGARELGEIMEKAKSASSDTLPTLEIEGNQSANRNAASRSTNSAEKTSPTFDRAAAEVPTANKGDADDKTSDKSAKAKDGQAKPEVNMAKIRQTYKEIADKANEDLITKDKFSEVIKQLPDKSSRDLAMEIMEQSVPNLTRRGVDQQLSGMLSEIESSGAKKITIAVLGEGTSGKALSYLARLNTKMEVEIKVLDEATMKAGFDGKNPVLVLDDITKATPAQQKFLKEMGQFYTSDLRGFDKGFNLWDLGIAKTTGSNEALKEKMAKLVEAAEKIKADNPKMTDADAVRAVLKDAFYKEAMLKYPNSDLKELPEDFPGKNRRAKKFAYQNQEQSALGELYDQIARPPVTPEQVEQFLKNYPPLKKHMGEADYPRMLEATARMLRDGIDYNSYPSMMEQSKELHGKLLENLKANGQTVDDVLIVTQLESSSSGHLLHHLYGRTNGLNESNFISAAELQKIAKESPGSLKGKTVVYLDDYSYSGRQPAKLLKPLAESINRSGARVVVAHLGAYEQKADPFVGLGIKPDVITARKLTNFYSPERMKEYGLPDEIIRELGGSSGYLKNFEHLNVEVGTVLPYRGPNNNVRLVREFSDRVLKLPKGKNQSDGYTEPSGKTADKPVERSGETRAQDAPNPTTSEPPKTTGNPSEVTNPANAEETSEFYDSQATQSRDGQTLKVETQKGANGVDIITDRTNSADVAKMLERYNKDEVFERFLEKRTREAKDENERRKMQEELDNYRRMSPAERTQVREAVVEGARARARSGGRATEVVGKVLSVGGTVIAVGMLVDILVSEVKTGEGPSARPANPQYRQ